MHFPYIIIHGFFQSLKRTQEKCFLKMLICDSPGPNKQKEAQEIPQKVMMAQKKKKKKKKEIAVPSFCHPRKANKANPNQFMPHFVKCSIISSNLLQ